MKTTTYQGCGHYSIPGNNSPNMAVCDVRLVLSIALVLGLINPLQARPVRIGSTPVVIVPYHHARSAPITRQTFVYGIYCSAVMQQQMEAARAGVPPKMPRGC